MAPVGSNIKVNGRSKPIVGTGPSPGRTPTNVPTKQPIKHAKRLLSVKTF
jgi:hypothetical protein